MIGLFYYVLSTSFLFSKPQPYMHCIIRCNFCSNFVNKKQCLKHGITCHINTQMLTTISLFLTTTTWLFFIPVIPSFFAISHWSVHPVLFRGLLPLSPLDCFVVFRGSPIDSRSCKKRLSAARPPFSFSFDTPQRTHSPWLCGRRPIGNSRYIEVLLTL